jgi:RNA polymerase sigma-19 factor, ECF subfamily
MKEAKIIPLYPMQHAADALLLELICSGDDSAFTILYYRYLPKIKDWVNILSRKNNYLSEDIAQDIFLKLSEQRGKLAEIRSFKNYLFFMVKNRLCSENITLEARQRAFREIVRNTVYSNNDCDSIILFNEVCEIHTNSVNLLPARAKQAYDLKEQYGLKYASIAKKMGITESSVKQHMGVAKEKIRAFVKWHYN